MVILRHEIVVLRCSAVKRLIGLGKVSEQVCDHSLNFLHVEDVVDAYKVFVFLRMAFFSRGVDNLEVVLVVHPVDQVQVFLLRKFLLESPDLQLLLDLVLLLLLQLHPPFFD